MSETPMFKVIENRVPISKIVAQEIEQAILNRSFIPGSKLPSELELCKLFGVSRTTIREAIQILNAQNMVTIIKGKGIFVNEINSDSFVEPLKKYLQQKLSKSYIRDLIQTRKVLEPSLAASAALNRTDDDIQRLNTAMEMLNKCESDFSELARLDMLFHTDLALSSHNQIMPIILEPIINSFVPILEVKSYVYETVENAKKSAYDSHALILKNVMDKDADGAFKAMTEHLNTAEEHTEMMLKMKYADDNIIIQ